MKPQIINNGAGAKAEAVAAGLGEKNGKQIIAMSRIKKMGEIGSTFYVLEDGTEVMEDDEQNVLAKWPETKGRQQ